MRNAFINSIEKMAEKDSRIILIVADIGFRIFDGFRSKFPDRFFNVGIAEANAISMAAGLAAQGFRPFVYGIASFITSRCLDQIRCNLAFHNSNVVMVGQGAGLAFGFDGFTHFAVDDVAILYPLPNMKILCPGDPIETEAVMRWIINNENTGPIYLRLGKNDTIIHNESVDFRLGKEIIISKEHGNIAILSMGNALSVAVQTNEMLKLANNSSYLVSMVSIKPIDEDLIRHIVQTFDKIVTIEEHSVFGGLGSIVAQYLSEKQKFYKFALPDKILDEVGDHNHLRKTYGLIAENICEVLNERGL
jgi:transketolase